MPSEDLPEFLITFKAATMEPGADVAPTGPVTFVLMNESESTHDFCLVNMGGDPATGRSQQRTQREPLGSSDPTLVATADGVAPGDAKTMTVELDAGRYCVLSNTVGEHLGTALFELTVQPADGSEPV